MRCTNPKERLEQLCPLLEEWAAAGRTIHDLARLMPLGTISAPAIRRYLPEINPELYAVFLKNGKAKQVAQGWRLKEYQK